MDDGVIVWDFKEKEDSSQGDGQAHIWWGGGEFAGSHKDSGTQNGL